MLSVGERGSGLSRVTLSRLRFGFGTSGGTNMGKKSGFTLIELLIVVVIIGILASIAIPKFSASREKSFVSTMRSDLKNLATYQEIHHNGAYTYSTSLSTLEMIPSSGVTITINEATGSGWAATAAHAGLTADHCGIYQGDGAAAGGDPGAAEGVIACTY